MFRILATSGHARDYVYKAVNKPLQFDTREKAKTWISNHEVDGVEYKVKEMKPKKAKPLHRYYKGRRSVKVVSLDALIEAQVK